MQLLVQVYLADYIKAYFGHGLGLVTSGLSLGLGLFCLGLRLLASASNFPPSFILLLLPRQPLLRYRKHGNRNYGNRDYILSLWTMNLHVRRRYRSRS